MQAKQKTLSVFENKMKKEIIKLKIIHWDDTVIFVSTNRACLRFYGDKQIAYYTAHIHKDKEGLDEDGVLSLRFENSETL